MSVLTKALYNLLAADAELAGLISTYRGELAVFTTDPAPGDAELPYIVSAGEVAQEPRDTKTTLGRTVTRDVRCYASETGSAETVENIAERVRELLHRETFAVDDYNCVIVNCTGPVVADEQDVYGRIVTVRISLERS